MKNLSARSLCGRLRPYLYCGVNQEILSTRRLAWENRKYLKFSSARANYNKSTNYSLKCFSGFVYDHWRHYIGCITITRCLNEGNILYRRRFQRLQHKFTEQIFLWCESMGEVCYNTQQKLLVASHQIPPAQTGNNWSPRQGWVLCSILSDFPQPK